MEDDGLPDDELELWHELEDGINWESLGLNEASYSVGEGGTNASDTPTKYVPDVKLSDEQEIVFASIRRGENVFFTGPAGTGKSVLLRQVVSWAKEKYAYDESEECVAVTASTGIAALNIGGRTLHSWAGIEHGKDSAQILTAKIRQRSMYFVEETGRWEIREGSPMDRWCKCRLLIVDEISMVDGRLIDKLDFIGRNIRRYTPDKPWGGLQVVFCGDFFQLPPVNEKEDGVRIIETFAFDAKSWPETIQRRFDLKKVFRQKDEVFVLMLNAMRTGQLSRAHIAELKRLQRPMQVPDRVPVPELYATRDQVEEANKLRLDAIHTPPHEYHAIDLPGSDRFGMPFPPSIVKRALKDMVALPEVILKVGAQVMLVKNLVQGELVNGSMGRVIGFQTAQEAHKESGLLFGLPECLNSYDNQKPQSPPNELLEDEAQRAWPVVEFPLSGKTIVCVPNVFEAVSASGTLEATREQIPLILAWALTIHKSQGQTLDYVRVNFDRMFERGQAYVALSRATSREGLEIVNFEPSRIEVHPRVLAWTRETSTDRFEDSDEETDDDWSPDRPNLKRKRSTTDCEGEKGV